MFGEYVNQATPEDVVLAQVFGYLSSIEPECEPFTEEEAVEWQYAQAQAQTEKPVVKKSKRERSHTQRRERRIARAVKQYWSHD